MNPLALPIVDAAPLFGVSHTTLRRWIRDEGFPVVRLGRKTLVPLRLGEQWLEDRAEVAA